MAIAKHLSKSRKSPRTTTTRIRSRTPLTKVQIKAKTSGPGKVAAEAPRRGSKVPSKDATKRKASVNAPNDRRDSRHTDKPSPAGDHFRVGSKGAAILMLLKRDGGATIAALVKVTGWQAHSVRGFLSGTLKKKLGLDVTSTKEADGQRHYRIAS